MLRITQVQLKCEAPAGSKSLRLEGTLHGESVAALVAACEPLLAASSPSTDVVLDVADVRFVDPAGAMALRDLQSRGWHTIDGWQGGARAWSARFEPAGGSTHDAIDIQFSGDEPHGFVGLIQLSPELQEETSK